MSELLKASVAATVIVVSGVGVGCIIGGHVSPWFLFAILPACIGGMTYLHLEEI